MSALVEPGTVVMVLDDDCEVRQNVADILSIEGYTVLAVASVAAALAELSRGSKPSVVVLDVWLPGIGSAEFVRRLKMSHADARVLILSGWPSSRIHLDADAFLTKPCEGTTIVRVVDKLARSTGDGSLIRRGPKRSPPAAASGVHGCELRARAQPITAR